ncbi:hypothetical protein REPUB_Repub06bG0051300 [Reevesia pubescens]
MLTTSLKKFIGDSFGKSSKTMVKLLMSSSQGKEMDLERDMALFVSLLVQLLLQRSED